MIYMYFPEKGGILHPRWLPLITSAAQAAVSIEEDEEADSFSCWDKKLEPVGNLERMAVLPEEQNKDLGRIMLKFGMDEWRRRGFKGICSWRGKYKRLELIMQEPLVQIT